MQSVAEFFPLIDDPANVFYSKLKNIFLYIAQIKPVIYDLNRVKRTIEFTLFGENHTIKKNYDARKIHADEDLRGKFAYVPLQFKIDLLKKDTTTGGELVDVNVGRLKFTRILDLNYGNKKLPFVFVDYSNDRLKEFNEIKIIEISPTGGNTKRIVIGLPLGVVQMDNRNGLYDISAVPFDAPYVDTFYPHDRSRFKDTYRTIYRPLIGRKLVVDESESVSKWFLYDIDSNYEEKLIDSYEEEPVYYNPNTRRWPYFYGNPITHTNKLRLFHESKNEIHTFTLLDREICNDNPYDNDIRYEIKLQHKSFNYTNDCLGRGEQVPPYSVRPINPYFRNQYYKTEYDALIDCYLTNINIRFYFLSYFDEELRVNRYTNNGQVYNFNLGGASYTVYPEIETLKPTRQGMEPRVWKGIDFEEDSAIEELWQGFMDNVRDTYNQNFASNFYPFSEGAPFYRNASAEEKEHVGNYVNAPVFNSLCFSLYCPYDREKKIQREVVDLGRLSSYVDEVVYPPGETDENPRGTRTCKAVTRLFSNFRQSPLYMKKVGSGSAKSFAPLLDPLIKHRSLDKESLSSFRFLVGYVKPDTIVDYSGLILTDIYGNDLALEAGFTPSKLILFCVGTNMEAEGNTEKKVFLNPESLSDCPTWLYQYQLNVTYDSNRKLRLKTGGSNIRMGANQIRSCIIAYR